MIPISAKEHIQVSTRGVDGSEMFGTRPYNMQEESRNHVFLVDLASIDLDSLVNLWDTNVGFVEDTEPRLNLPEQLTKEEREKKRRHWIHDFFPTALCVFLSFLIALMFKFALEGAVAQHLRNHSPDRSRIP